MLLPRLFGFDDADSFWNDDFFTPAPQRTHTMRMDVRELANAYQVDVELPGYKKEDVKAELKDGYLTISAETTRNSDEKDADGSYLRRERYTGSCSRTLYVGKDLRQEDIHAKFENGILTLDFPKEAPQQAEENHFIQID
ncbi:MAG: Hsp20/alpha crystallin family protein [Eubacterium sp.]|nr:Hsp20/alpha crystallin family protein [Eubacterium sp.]